MFVTQEQLKKERSEVEKEEMAELYNIADRYCQEYGHDDIDYGNVKKWCKRNKIPIPLKLAEYIKHQEQQKSKRQ